MCSIKHEEPLESSSNSNQSTQNILTYWNDISGFRVKGSILTRMYRMYRGGFRFINSPVIWQPNHTRMWLMTVHLTIPLALENTKILQLPLRELSPSFWPSDSPFILTYWHENIWHILHISIHFIYLKLIYWNKKCLSSNGSQTMGFF